MCTALPTFNEDMILKLLKQVLAFFGSLNENVQPIRTCPFQNSIFVRIVKVPKFEALNWRRK